MFYSCVSGYMDVNTLVPKCSQLIGNAEIVRMRCVIHNNSTCVGLRLPVAAITQKRKNASFDLWLALDFTLEPTIMPLVWKSAVGPNRADHPLPHPHGQPFIEVMVIIGPDGRTIFY